MERRHDYRFKIFGEGKMKILITHEIFPPERTGGGEDVMSRLAKDLMARGHEVLVLTSGDPHIKEFERIPTKRIPINRYALNFFQKQIEAEAKNFDLIQTSSGNLCLPSWQAARKLKKPVVCIVHHAFGKFWKDVRGPVIGRIFAAAEKYFLSRDYDYLIVQNKSTEKLVKEINRKSKTVFLPSGLENISKIKPMKKEKYVLFVGSHNTTKQIAKIKGLKYLLATAKELQEIEFMIVGGGNYLEKIRRNAPSNIKFLGRVVGKPLYELYGKALIFCLPSLAEGFSRATAEAMAAGCAIVSTIDLGQAGEKIEPKRAENISERIKFYFENPDVARAEGKKNSAAAKKFSWKKFVDGIEKIYIESLQRSTS